MLARTPRPSSGRLRRVGHRHAMVVMVALLGLGLVVGVLLLVVLVVVAGDRGRSRRRAGVGGAAVAVAAAVRGAAAGGWRRGGRRERDAAEIDERAGRDAVVIGGDIDLDAGHAVVVERCGDGQRAPVAERQRIVPGLGCGHGRSVDHQIPQPKIDGWRSGRPRSARPRAAGGAASARRRTREAPFTTTSPVAAGSAAVTMLHERATCTVGASVEDCHAVVPAVASPGSWAVGETVTVLSAATISTPWDDTRGVVSALAETTAEPAAINAAANPILRSPHLTPTPYPRTSAANRSDTAFSPNVSTDASSMPLL